MKETALYVHIPFCDHKCIYCDFYSIITKDNIAAFLNSLKKEIEYYSRVYNENRVFTSIFFGGGTPSLMQASYVSEIIQSLRDNFYIPENTEITLETNPGTVDKDKLKDFYSAGVNRISVGVQSFNDEELKFLTRIHNKQKAISTVQNAAGVGFENISIDLIFNLPGQTKEKWKNNLSIAADLPLKHISAYSLILERGTILNKMVLDKKVIMQGDDYDADLYEMTIDFLAGKNFYQYEVSNFAKKDFECRHNNAYWRYKDYLSFGPSAHSFVDGKRWWNFSSLKRYIAEIENSRCAAANSEIITAEQKLDEYVMLALRSKGINVKELKELFGESWISQKYNYLKQLTDIKLIKKEGDFFSLTSAGYAVCDEILTNLL